MACELLVKNLKSFSSSKVKISLLRSMFFFLLKKFRNGDENKTKKFYR